MEKLTGIERLTYEKEATSPFVGKFGLRTLFNLIWAIAGFVGVIILTENGTLPLLAGMALSALFVQAFYMPMHESVHHTPSGGNPKLSWFDNLVGQISGFVLCESFTGHVRIHLLHHTHANGEEDPDVLNSEGTPAQIFGRTIAGASLYLLTPFLAFFPSLALLFPKKIRERFAERSRLRGPEVARAIQIVATFHVLLLTMGTIFGYGKIVWLLWYLPTWAARYWLALVFAWLPHRPHEETTRYRDTRIFTFPGSTFLIRGHDHHLLHHLFPRVPHYHLRTLWKEMAPHLHAQGARIEGNAARHALNMSGASSQETL